MRLNSGSSWIDTRSQQCCHYFTIRFCCLVLHASVLLLTRRLRRRREGGVVSPLKTTMEDARSSFSEGSSLQQTALTLRNKARARQYFVGVATLYIYTFFKIKIFQNLGKCNILLLLQLFTCLPFRKKSESCGN